MPQVLVNSITIEYLSKDNLCLLTQLVVPHQWLDFASALRKLYCIQFIAIELQLLQSQSMVLDDVEIRKLQANVEWPHFENIGNLENNFKEGFVGGEFLLEYLLSVVVLKAVIEYFEPY